MDKHQISSFEWTGRVMGPVRLVYDAVVGGAERREREQAHARLIEAAYTDEAVAWNILSNISTTSREIVVPVPFNVPMYSLAESSPDEAVPPAFRFRRIGERGTLFQRWELLGRW